MTRTLFLHAGPPKTGTTAIQTYFHRNAEGFANLGLYRPWTGTEMYGHVHLGLVTAFVPGHKHAALLDELDEELAAVGKPERVFVSCEMFAARFNNRNYVATLQAFAERIGYDLHVITYIRPQAQLLNSLYAQHVKNWRIVPAMERYLQQQLQDERHDYSRQFAALLGASGIKTTFRPFNAETLKQGIAGDICRIIGLSGDFEGHVPPGKANVAPGPRTVAAFQRIRRRASAEYPKLNENRLSALSAPLLGVAGSLGWNDARFGGITPAMTEMLKQHFQHSNEALARHAWRRPWDEVFSAAEQGPPPFNVFDPADAPPRQRVEFRKFIDQAVESIGEFAADYQSQVLRMKRR